MPGFGVQYNTVKHSPFFKDSVLFANKNTVEGLNNRRKDKINQVKEYDGEILFELL
jgi:hypothetical protein